MKKELIIAIATGLAFVGLLLAISKMQVNVNVTRSDCGCGEVGIYDEADCVPLGSYMGT